jgi:hypothetical protein
MNLLVKGLTIAVCVLPLKTDDDLWTDEMTDQEKCQAEADFMLKYHKNYHVGDTIGRFEGIGYSVNGKVPLTCTPDKEMKLTGDATATDGNRVTRVRSWR